jgi:hypothetical protein
MNPESWVELTVIRLEELVADSQAVEEGGIDAQAAQFDDNSDLPCEIIIAHVHSHQIDGVEVQGGHLVSTAATKTIKYNGDKPDWADDMATANGEGSSSRGPGKRKVTTNKLYNG